MTTEAVMPLTLLVVVTWLTMLFGGEVFGIQLAPEVSLILLATGLFTLLLLSLVQAAITGIYGAALYRYSTGDHDGSDPGPSEFSPEMMGAAFAAK
jgi:hypothetical protein